MSTNITFYCALHGNRFDPSQLLSNSCIDVENYHFVGDFSKLTGRLYDFGYIRFSKSGVDLNGFLEELESLKIRNIIESVEEKELHLFIEYVSQCNWELSPCELAKIYNLGLTLTFSCDIVKET